MALFLHVDYLKVTGLPLLYLRNSFKTKLLCLAPYRILFPPDPPILPTVPQPVGKEHLCCCSSVRLQRCCSSIITKPSKTQAAVQGALGYGNDARTHSIPQYQAAHSQPYIHIQMQTHAYTRTHIFSIIFLYLIFNLSLNIYLLFLSLSLTRECASYGHNSS